MSENTPHEESIELSLEQVKTKTQTVKQFVVENKTAILSCAVVVLAWKNRDLNKKLNVAIRYAVETSRRANEAQRRIDAMNISRQLSKR